MRNRAFLKVALLGLLTLALAPGYAAAAGQGQDLTEMLASTAAVHATAVSGPICSASPLNMDFGIVNNGDISPGQVLTISNTGDQTLNISSISSSDAAFNVAPGPFTVAPGGNQMVSVHFDPTDGNAHSGTINIISNASNGTVSVSVSGQGNSAPTLDPVGNKTVAALINLSFTVTGSDNADTVDDQLSFSMSAGLPPGPTFNTTNGSFSWTPSEANVGTYSVTFCISDGRLSDCEGIQITVTAATNHPPVANAGGSYTGATNQALQFNGSGSSDPDGGQTLSYHWAFGDGGTANVVSPLHTYGAPGNYIASLQVCDNGSPVLCSTDVASVTIVTVVPAQAILKNNGNTIRTHGGGKEKVGIEENVQSLTTIEVSSIRMSTDYPGAGTVSSISAQTKGAVIGDMDLDGVADLDVYFLRSDINLLFGNVPNNTVVNMIITGNMATATGSIPFKATKSVVIKASGNAVQASAYPNPFNPETSIALTLKNSGPLTVRIYSLDGRLIRTLMEGEFATTGTHEVRWNGIDNQGNHVPSAVYFVKASQGTETSVFKLIVAK